jgi:hypothetical protein
VSSLRPSDDPVLLSSLLLLCNSSDASRISTVGSSDGVNFVWPAVQCTKCTDACTDGTVSSSDSVNFLPFLLNLACGIFASFRPRNVYKDMLNNMVSPINHVVMNHQNQTRTDGIWGHVLYTCPTRKSFYKPNLSGLLILAQNRGGTGQTGAPGV